jgi:hypothetical protein
MHGYYSENVDIVDLKLPEIGDAHPSPEEHEDYDECASIYWELPDE